jgi:hypothetical protein
MFQSRVVTEGFLTRVGAIVSIVALAGAVPSVFAASTVQYEKLSTSQKARLPGSAVVKVGTKLTTTLGKLRSAHKAREQARIDAKARGAAAGKLLKAKQLGILRVSKTAAKTIGKTTGKTIEKHGKVVPIVGHIGPIYGFNPTPTPFPLHLVVGGYVNPVLLGNLATTVIEPASSYASAPADMRAFCSAAQASACAYLPPNQTVQRDNTIRIGWVDDLDSQITDPQCSQEGGFMSSFGWGSSFCWFTYPGSVNVQFNPGNYQIATSASCNPPWTYNVDVHGAITIGLGNTGPYLTWPSGSNPTCIVRVTVGS